MALLLGLWLLQTLSPPSEQAGHSLDTPLLVGLYGPICLPALLSFISLLLGYYLPPGKLLREDLEEGSVQILVGEDQTVAAGHAWGSFPTILENLFCFTVECHILSSDPSVKFSLWWAQKCWWAHKRSAVAVEFIQKLESSCSIPWTSQNCH